MPARATIPVPGYPEQTYFFSGSKYARIEWRQGKSDDTIISGPKDITAGWTALNQASFNTVDAVLQSPVTADVLYFFRGAKYAKVRLDYSSLQDSLLFGPTDIYAEWPTLKAAGFDTVDTVLTSPVGGGVTYFFRGTQYIKIKLELVNDRLEDRLLFGPADIASQWPSLVQAKFDTVDNVLPSQSDNTVVYFFSGDKYVKVQLTPHSADSVNDTVLFGPTLVANEWPSLVAAGFY